MEQEFQNSFQRYQEQAQRYNIQATPRELVFLMIGLRASHIEEALAHGDFDRAMQHFGEVARLLQESGLLDQTPEEIVQMKIPALVNTNKGIAQYQDAFRSMVELASSFQNKAGPRDILFLKIGLRAAHLEEAVRYQDQDRARVHLKALQELVREASGASPAAGGAAQPTMNVSPPMQAGFYGYRGYRDRGWG